ncbi:MAG: hypothetical protein HN509_08055 [Halobacteriovoraceae bacterium]|jgi:hypothetical protein|nr:hypothetical protein [Halobacteriovoraceae bacterium]
MNTMILDTLYSSNQMVVLLCLSLATFRLFLEVIGFEFKALPITKKLAKYNGEERLERFHRWGFYFSVGYILLFAPGLLLS